MYSNKSQRVYLYTLEEDFYKLVHDNYYIPLGLDSNTILKVFSKDHDRTKEFVKHNKSILYEKDVIDYLVHKVGIKPSELLYIDKYTSDFNIQIQRIKDCNCIIPDEIMEKYINMMISQFWNKRKGGSYQKKAHINYMLFLRTLFQYGGNPFVDGEVINIKNYKYDYYFVKFCKSMDRIIENRQKWVIRCITSIQRKFHEYYYLPGNKGFDIAYQSFKYQLNSK
jgi:hypothetical protein